MPQKIRTSGDSGYVIGWLEDHFDGIDSAVFSGDSLHNREALDRLDHYLARWQRELGLVARESAAVEYSARLGEKALCSGANADIFGVMVENGSTGIYYIEVHSSKQDAVLAWEAYWEADKKGVSNPVESMGYLACKSYMAPGYESGKLLAIVNRDDFTPQITVPENRVLNRPADEKEDSLHGVLVENRESRKIALIVFESKHQAAEFHFENCGRPASAAVAFVPNRCAVAFMVGDTVESLLTDIGGKAIIIFNPDDAEVVDGEENAPIEMRGMIANVSF